MTTVVYTQDWTFLEKQLCQQLRPQLPLAKSLEVKCVLRNSDLVLLLEHAAATRLDSRQIFQVLECQLSHLWGSAALQQPQKVRAYLKSCEASQPYAFHGFWLQAPPGEAEPASIAAPVEFHPPSNNSEEKVAASLDSVAPLARHDEMPPDGSRATIFRTTQSHPPEGLTPVADSALDHALSPDAVDAVAAAPRIAPLSWRWLMGGFVGTFLLVGGGLVLSRPCVLGSCAPLESARQMKQELAKVSPSPDSMADLVRLQQQLRLVLANLQDVPPWSRYHHEAGAMRQTVSERLAIVEQLLQAYNLAGIAEQRQGGVRSVAEWQETQKLWQQAIALLEKVPRTSETFSLAQKQLQTYHKRLVLVEKDLAIESLAQDRLQQARSNAQIAKAREGIAQNLQSWQLVQATWQSAIALLSQVPSGTFAQQEARRLQPAYEAKLAAIRNRVNREKIMADAYQQATQLARQAEVLEQQGQWLEAVSRWQGAVAALRQVGQDTFYHNHAQALLGKYHQSLQQASLRLQTERNLQQAQLDLQRTCWGVNTAITPAAARVTGHRSQNLSTQKPGAATRSTTAATTMAPLAPIVQGVKVCDFTITPQIIYVRLTPEYMQATGIATMGSDLQARQRIESHTRILQTALSVVSNNTRLPLDLYDANNTLLGRYLPRS